MLDTFIKAVTDFMTGNDKRLTEVETLVQSMPMYAVQFGADLPVRPDADIVIWMTWDDPTSLMRERDVWFNVTEPAVVDEPQPDEPAPAPVVEPANIIFTDDFARADEYISASGNWSDVLTGNDPEGLSVIGGQAGTLEVQDFQFVRLSQEVPQDVALQLRVLASAKTMQDNRGVTLGVRMQANATDGGLPDGYYLTVTASEWLFFKRVGGFTESMTSGRPYNATLPAVVRLEARGNIFEGFINGVRYFTLSDEALGSGSVGFGIKAAWAEGPESVRVDDVQVEAL